MKYNVNIAIKNTWAKYAGKLWKRGKNIVPINNMEELLTDFGYSINCNKLKHRDTSTIILELGISKI